MNKLLLTLLVNHLWQSTLFAAAVGGLALLLRRNGARVRYLLWYVASLKFLLPFAVLAALCTHIPWHPDAPKGSVAPRILALAGDFTAPLSGDIVYPQLLLKASAAALPPDSAPAVADASWLVPAFILWALGAAFVLVRWQKRSIEIRRVLRASSLMTGIEFPAPVRSTTRQFEPGVVGTLRPVLLLPAGIEKRLTHEQMRAVLAHERCHLRRHDNFTAAMHMAVEMLFWFYPPVWWIGARLIEERERACDEQVIREGNAPESYAEAILAVCEHYIASRLPCVSGISGADLRRRIESILRSTLALKLDKARKLLLATLACCAVAAPIAAGILSGNAMQMIFSSAYTGAIGDYFEVGLALYGPLNGARSTFSRASRCPAPAPEFIRSRKVLAAMVARLSPTDGEKVLLFAVAANSTADVRRLLAGGAPRNGDGFLGEDSLMHAAARYADVPMLELLANAGFSIDAQDRSGRAMVDGTTPLMVAISMGRMENADWLIRHGANVSASSSDGRSALLSAMIDCRSQALVTRLIDAGAVPNDRARRIALSMRFDLGAAATTAVAAVPRAVAEQPPPTAARSPMPSPITDEELQRDWLRPTQAVLDEQPWRKDSTSRYTQARADFDGDGREDEAVLLVWRSGWMESIFVKLSSHHPDRWQEMTRRYHNEQSTALLSGIRVVEPGQVQPRTGLDFFEPNGVSAVAYWDEAAGRFRPIPK